MTTTEDLMRCGHDDHQMFDANGAEQDSCVVCGEPSDFVKSLSALEWRKVLVLSTGHITDAQTRLWLGSESPWPWAEEGGILAHGWYVWVATQPERGKYPPDLWRCILFARAAGAEYIQFDADGPQVDGLPYVEF